MKTLKESILSSTRTGKSTFLIPKNKKELKRMIEKEIYKNGWKCDLNHIKTHNITDMSFLFKDLKYFNGDISKWDVSNVFNMTKMFYNSDFNGDISNWDVSNVTSMGYMFSGSKFNGDISKWDVSNAISISHIFYNSKKFNGDISKWDVSNAMYMSNMFAYSNFNRDISNWKIKPLAITAYMFYDCPIKEEYKPKQNGKTIE